MTTECRMLRGAPPCCPACHGNYRCGYDEPIECEVDGLVAQVCCTVARWLIRVEREQFAQGV